MTQSKSPNRRVSPLNNRLPSPPNRRVSPLNNRLPSLNNRLPSPNRRLPSPNRRVSPLNNRLPSPNRRVSPLNNRLPSPNRFAQRLKTSPRLIAKNPNAKPTVLTLPLQKNKLPQARNSRSASPI